MDLNFDLYMNDVVEQANEIEHAGYQQLTSAEDVDQVLQQKGTSLVMVNSYADAQVGLHVLQRHMHYIMINYLND